MEKAEGVNAAAAGAPTIDTGNSGHDWDRAIQNLWSLIIAADGDFEANMALTERFFYLVG